MKRTYVKLIAFMITAMMLVIPTVCYAAEVDEPIVYYNFEDGGKDLGTYGSDLIATGSPATKAKAEGENGPGGKYLVVDTENFYRVSRDALQFGTGNFSLSVWMKLPSDTPDGNFMRLFQCGYWGENTPGFVIAATRNGEQASFANGIAAEGGTDADGTWGFYGLCDNFYDDQWHHFVFAFDQEFGEYAIYMDGEKVLTRIVGVKDTLKANASWDLALGFLSLDGVTAMEATAPHLSLEMGIDEFAIYDTFLMDDAVAAIYEASKDAPAPEAPAGNDDATDDGAAGDDTADNGESAPQTGFATAIFVLGAILSGAYVSSKRH